MNKRNIKFNHIHADGIRSATRLISAGRMDRTSYLTMGYVLLRVLRPSNIVVYWVLTIRSLCAAKDLGITRQCTAI